MLLQERLAATFFLDAAFLGEAFFGEAFLALVFLAPAFFGMALVFHSLPGTAARRSRV
jgi:hypothetical protein